MPPRSPSSSPSGSKKPHVPLKAPQEFFDLYEAEELPLPPDFANEPTLPRDADPRNTRRNLDLYADRDFTAAEARAALHAYYACVSYMDAQLGRVLDALEAQRTGRQHAHRPVGRPRLASE